LIQIPWIELCEVHQPLMVVEGHVALPESHEPAFAKLPHSLLPPPRAGSNDFGALSMNFRPLHDRVVVKRADTETKTSGGIIIPDTAGEKPQQGKVIAVGPGSRDEVGKLVPLDIKKGDKVLFGQWSGTEVNIDGDELLIMKESNVMGVLDK
jgi:chaperonin GroES